MPANKRKTTEEFVREAVAIHGQTYDYSDCSYVRRYEKLAITCSEHGVFYQTPSDHLRGGGCRLCGIARRGIGRRGSLDAFLEKAKEIHGCYSYAKSAYIGNRVKLEIECRDHGSFWMTPTNHISGRQGCPKCAGKTPVTTEEFRRRCGLIHGSRYSYDRAVYSGAESKVEIICPEHGSFLQRPYDHLGGQGCPRCLDSRGERAIVRFLAEHGIVFEAQKRFSSCKDKRTLPFDFCLPDSRVLIEFDGKQHFEPVGRFGGKDGFDLTSKRDRIKNTWAKVNGYKLIRISYKEFSDIEQLLSDALLVAAY